VRAEDGGAPRWPTRVELGFDGSRLEIDFDCVDDDPWGTLQRRDAPLWTEEVVEVFLAPGAPTPHDYFELELSPLGALFDARFHAPQGDRRGMVVDPAWDCAGLEWHAARRPGGWTAGLRLPLAALGAGAPPPRIWRINFFRIERPRPGPPEHSAWSPTRVTPADFHRPARFGRLELG
jgi:hypothetical protein